MSACGPHEVWCIHYWIPGQARDDKLLGRHGKLEARDDKLLARDDNLGVLHDKLGRQR